jgi:hypothetical protein
MTLRIGFDMDGVLADFSTAFREVEARLFATGELSAEAPEKRERTDAAGGSTETQTRPDAGNLYRRREAVWEQIKATPDFWTTLKPLDPGAVGRIHALMLRHGWEVVFITQRPATDGDTVQRQTQRWLIDQGFDMPSVVVISGSRGTAAGALRLNYHVDDNEQHCIEVLADSKAKPILVLSAEAAGGRREARRRGIAIAQSIRECLDVLDQASSARSDPGLLRRIVALMGWR